eukprot:CAMPEP_0194177090 /NCGR_PEP_ID=MMETSP0154-20130528/10942_1 /TAXON_ID=1049557 /ORGANISM="Thalassiothrix antarctica, Strain L6-D1" /LENGTH=536 /DNA_ID=CAMNT_0038891571 /DNA_START=87 /DNA_END=1694 /DNA_ORIENTATION=+
MLNRRSTNKISVSGDTTKKISNGLSNKRRGNNNNVRRERKSLPTIVWIIITAAVTLIVREYIAAHIGDVSTIDFVPTSSSIIPSSRVVGPPSNFIVTGKLSSYIKVPSKYRKTFFIDPKTSFRRTVIRAFRNRGWRKSEVAETAHMIWDKVVLAKRFTDLKPWQRYDFIPGFSSWDKKDNFIKGFNKYKSRHPEKDLYMIPETYLLDKKEDREAFSKRLYDNNGLSIPWVLKTPDVNNGQGITMLGPNSEELDDVLNKVEEGSDNIIQAYICNELTWWGNKKFDLRFYWMVVSIDPLIVLYHDGYVRVGNSKYDESDWSSTKQHLTTHTYLADEDKGTIQNLKDLVREHYNNNIKTLEKKIKLDPFEHIRNQFKQSIAETVGAFYYDTFGQSKKKYKPQNGFGMYGADFVLDNDLDVWYVESQAGPGLEEEFDFRVEMHRDLLRGMIDLVDEIQTKLENDPQGNVLPLQNQAGWDIVYAGNPDKHWMYHYDGYSRSKRKKGCTISDNVKGKTEKTNFNPGRKKKSSGGVLNPDAIR